MLDFDFERMNFDDIYSIGYYGHEVLEEARLQTSVERSIINVNMRDEELTSLINSIPLSIDEEIDKNIEQNMPVGLTFLEKLIEFKLVGFLVPKKIKSKITGDIEDAKNNNENNNSINLYQSIMNNIDNIRFKIEDEYNISEEVIRSLKESKDSIIQLIKKFDIVIEAGESSIEEYKNSDKLDSPELKSRKIDAATSTIISLKKSRATLNGFIQSKDITALNIFMYLNNLKDWLQSQYPILSLGVETAIETKYISNKVNQLNNLNETSNKVILDSATTLKETTEKNISMLQTGSLDTATINRYLKTVNQALLPVKGFIESKENTTRKLLNDIEKIESEINKNYTLMESIGDNYVAPSLENSPKKQLKLGNNHKYE